MKCREAACAGRMAQANRRGSHEIRGKGVTNVGDTWQDVTLFLFFFPPGRPQGGEGLLRLPGGGEEQEREFWHG